MAKRYGEVPLGNGHFQIRNLPKHKQCANPKCQEVLKQLKDIVRCIREFQLGDYSPLMDEIFDSEHAINEAEGEHDK